tara:strand:- start:2341 stop:2868 length:528 start_codon:yes stop_codon:yes gene_type:complete
MKYLVSFFVIILITICATVSKAESSSIVYINMEKVMNNTIAGKSLVQQLEKIHNKNISHFKKKEKELKDKENKIISQKNILSNDEYVKKVNLLKDEVSAYKKNRKNKIDDVSKKKVEATSKLLNQINPIIADYSQKNNISMILRKKDLVIARTDLDITNEIIEIVNSKIKKINLN